MVLIISSMDDINNLIFSFYSYLMICFNIEHSTTEIYLKHIK